MVYVVRSAVIWVLIPCLAMPAVGQSLLKIDAFEPWQGELPEGWRSSEGARSGEGPASRLSVVDGALVIEGDADTCSWRYLTHPFPVQPGDCLRLGFEARLRDAQVQRFQFDNHFVALEFQDADGLSLGREVLQVAPSGEWDVGSLVAMAPPAALRGAIGIFLAHTGQLALRRLALERVPPESSFDLLVDGMTRSYSHLATREVQWGELTGRYRERALAATDGARFAAVLVEMLAELRDGHVWVEPPQGGRLGTFNRRVDYNIEPQLLFETIESTFHERGVALVGRTPEGFGYVGLGTFQCAPERFARVEEAVRALFDAPALLFDARANGGGNEELARRIAGLLTREPVVYSVTKVRNGPKATDFGAGNQRALQPIAEAHYDGPVVCLSGPGCVSSCECFVQMMRALPQVRVVGQATRGSSGNPAPLRLPNGVTVWFSRWVNASPEGEPVEGRGVPPDLVVEHVGEGDPTLEAGLRELTRLVQERER